MMMVTPVLKSEIKRKAKLNIQIGEKVVHSLSNSLSPPPVRSPYVVLINSVVLPWLADTSSLFS